MNVLALSQISILIQWGLPDIFEQNGPIVGYDIVLAYTNGSGRMYNTLGDVFSFQIEGNSQNQLMLKFVVT